MEKKPLKHIILIDDDSIINMINRKIISLFYDFKIESFTDARAALEYLTNTPPPMHGPRIIIFLDINMPVMDGWEFLDDFEKLPPEFLEHCSVFMLTSSIDLEDIAKSKAYKTVRDFISKPLSEDRLTALKA